MADKKVTALTDISTGVAGADLLHIIAQQVHYRYNFDIDLREN